MSPRSVLVSTVAPSPTLILAAASLPCKLAWSVHAAEDELNPNPNPNPNPNLNPNPNQGGARLHPYSAPMPAASSYETPRAKGWNVWKAGT